MSKSKKNRGNRQASPSLSPTDPLPSAGIAESNPGKALNSPQPVPSQQVTSATLGASPNSAGPNEISLGTLIGLMLANKLSFGLKAVVLLLVTTVSSVATIWVGWSFIDAKIKYAVEEKVGTKIKELENTSLAVQRENELLRMALECQCEMHSANCRDNWRAALLAYEELERKCPIDSVPESLRNSIFQEFLMATTDSGRFQFLKQSQIDHIAGALENWDKKTCPTAYVNLGICYLSLNQPERARKVLWRVPYLEPAPDFTNLPRAYSLLALSTLMDAKQKKANKMVATAMQIVEECRTVILVPYASIHEYMNSLRQSELIAHLRRLKISEDFSVAFSALLETLKKKAAEEPKQGLPGPKEMRKPSC
jgi:hypothetical protein